eukprot:s1053_g19.t1
MSATGFPLHGQKLRIHKRGNTFCAFLSYSDLFRLNLTYSYRFLTDSDHLILLRLFYSEKIARFPNISNVLRKSSIQALAMLFAGQFSCIASTLQRCTRRWQR